MIQYLVRRLLLMVLVLLGVSVLTFVVSQAIPGDPARVAAGENAPDVTVQVIRRQMGLDKPLAVQYLIYVKRLAVRDLGKSIISARPVLDDLRDYYPATIELALSSLIFSCAVGIPAGIWTALNRENAADQGTRMVSLFAVSMPVFWLGLILQLLFYGLLQWLPSGGQVGEGFGFDRRVTGFLLIDSLLFGRLDVWFSAVQHLILPLLCLSGITVAEITRMTRASVLDVLPEHYVTAARAKGLRERVVLGRHVFRNALVPVLTILGLRFGHNLGGAVLVETIFAWPGVGRYSVQAIENKDFPAIMGAALTMAILYSLVNLLIDLAHMWSDPRLRYA